MPPGVDQEYQVLSDDILPLSEEEFLQFQHLLYRAAGLSLSVTKKTLISGRLAKRVRQQSLTSFGDYYHMLMSHKGELQTALNLLTTNETYFFREEKHFEFLRNVILPELQNRLNIRIWSAASSSGEEPYSIALVLSEILDWRPWEVIGSDISTRVLEQAKSGIYSMAEVEDVPKYLLMKHFLKGVGTQIGNVQVEAAIRNRVHFYQINLNEMLPMLGDFEVIFLRNVMIYFDQKTRKRVVERLIPRLRPGGYFFVGHSETLNGVTTELEMVQPSIYRKPL